MGAAAAAADFVVVTSDNPRSEDPARIAEAARAGVVAAGGTPLIELDRRAAMRATSSGRRRETWYSSRGRAMSPARRPATGRSRLMTACVAARDRRADVRVSATEHATLVDGVMAGQGDAWVESYAIDSCVLELTPAGLEVVARAIEAGALDLGGAEALDS